MALTIEDGSGVAGADSYLTVAQLDAIGSDYFGQTASGTDAQKEASLRRAFIYMKSLSWIGDFPDFDDELPDDVKTVQGIFAYHESNNANTLQPSVTTGQQRVLKSVGSVEWEVTASSGVDAQRAVVTMAMDLLKPYLKSSNFLARA